MSEYDPYRNKPDTIPDMPDPISFASFGDIEEIVMDNGKMLVLLFLLIAVPFICLLPGIHWGDWRRTLGGVFAFAGVWLLLKPTCIRMMNYCAKALNYIGRLFA